MTAADFFSASRVLFVAGKGGVGKTTVGATIGVAAATAGLNTLLIELEGHSTLGRSFGIEQLDYEDIELIKANKAGGQLRARRVTPDDALAEYLADHGMSGLSQRLSKSGTIDVISTAAPGIRDLLALGKIRRIETNSEADLIVVDAPAAGHAITFLSAAAGLSNAGADGPVAEQADAVQEMLQDESRCRVVLVTLAEETPVSELIETAYSLEDTVGVALGPVVVNNVLGDIPGLKASLESIEARSPKTSSQPADRSKRAAAEYRLGRQASQASEIDRLREELPLPQIVLETIFSAFLDRQAIDSLAESLLAQLDTKSKWVGR